VSAIPHAFDAVSEILPGIKERSINMCGIVGYVGSREATPVLMNGLKRLEYRGYDSAGIAILHEGKIKMVKTKGRLAALEGKLNSVDLKGHMGIGHTRWATHGEPSDANSHPHVSSGGKIAVVHNGILENYIKLKDFLISRGYNFQSETDTEVVANLIDYNYRDDLVKAVIETLNEMEGAYALGVICTDCPDEFVAARKDSPLIVGLGKDENYIASDIPAILEYTKNVIILEDREVVRISAGRAEIFNLLGERVYREVFHVDWDVASAEKGGYEHFMMKEICEEPAVVKAAISPRIRDGQILFENFSLTDEMVRSCEKINIVACGTAYHAGVVGKYAIERLVRISVEADLASEFRYRDPMVDKKQITIIISQSGETLDTLMALREARKKGSHVVSIVNVVGRSIARESDDVLYTFAGPEIAVASTKAYNAQLTVLYLLALKFGQIRGTVNDEDIRYYLDQLMGLPGNMEHSCKENK
jgi:glucosamine--fructose-6-phosphate aminotransferase (isomerizing)